MVNSPSSKLANFALELQKYKVSNPFDKELHEPGRHTYCNLILLEKAHNYPIFEVRGWQLRGSILNVSVVNWTVAAGTASLNLTEDNIDQFKILEDNPTLRVLYDK